MTPRKRHLRVDLVKLKEEIEAGTLSEDDRALAETLLPGVCDLVMGKVKSISGSGPEGGGG